MIILVAGGSGFIGSHVVKALKAKGHTVIVHHNRFKAIPTHADVVVNLVGIIREGPQTFREAHVEKTQMLLRLGKKYGVRQFVQISAIGAERGATLYHHTKALAEDLVRSSGLPYAIIRPSMVFGKEDKSVNTFRALARTGFLPLFGNGTVQPISVDTLADLVVAAVDKRIRNRTVEVGGPEVMTYRQLADRIHPGVTVFLLPRPICAVFTFIGRFLPPLPTPDMAKMLEGHNTTSDHTVERLGIKNPRLR